jgi:hypothetical protein
MALTPQQEADYQRLKSLENILGKDPETVLEFERLIKKADPKSRTPRLDQHDLIEGAVDKRVKEVTAEVEALRKKLIESEADQINEKQTRKLKRAPYNLTDEDLDEVKKLVAEKARDGELIGLETMARFYIAQRSPVGPSNAVRTPFSTRLNRPKNDWRKALRDPKHRIFKDTRNYLNEEYETAWNEGLELAAQQER